MVRRRCTCALQLRVTLTLACGIFGVRVARAQTQCDAPIAAKTATDILLTMQSMSKSISTCTTELSRVRTELASMKNTTAELQVRVKNLEERTKVSMSCAQIAPDASPAQTCVDKVRPSSSVLWSNRNYGWTKAPSELLSGAWTYVRPALNGGPCAKEGGFSGEIKATADVAICCANHCGKSNIPVATPADAGNQINGWYQHPGSFAITQHGGSPCTFFEAKAVKPGKYKICCSACWASGPFFGAGDNTPPPIDKYIVKTSTPLKCSEIRNKRGGQYGSCQYQGAKVGAPLWSNRNYAWTGGPTDLLDGTWTYNKVHLNGGPCAKEGGFEGSVTSKTVAAICCANHCGRSNVPTGGEAWTKHPGVFSISNHGGTPCTFYETTLQPNKPYKICCSACWASGSLFKHAA